MDRDVVRVDEMTPISEVVNRMLGSGVWSVLVERAQSPIGCLTERDIIRRAVAKGANLEAVHAKEIMSSPLITIGPDASMSEAMKVMTEKKVRRLFVLENEKIVGRITQTDLLRSNLDVMLSLSSMQYQI